MDRRVYKFKKPVMNFFCPLCRSERFFIYNARPTMTNYLQITMFGIFMMVMTYKFLGLMSVVFFFLGWGGFELCLRILHKREIPCPYCGFDATWYKRDVRVAKKLVKDFWENGALVDAPLSSKSAFKKESTAKKTPLKEKEISL